MTAAVQIALQTAALRNLKKRPAALVNGPKPAWFAASFINFFGPVAYFIFGRKRLISKHNSLTISIHRPQTVSNTVLWFRLRNDALECLTSLSGIDHT